MSQKIDFEVITDIGLKREKNEDNFILKESKKHSNLLLIGVIDGVGGYNGGEIAAKICKNTVEALFVENEKGFYEQPIEFLTQALILANNAIYIQKQEDSSLSNMSCVASFGLLDSDNHKLYFVHIGDSRIYVLGDGLVKVSTDHSFVGRLEEQGKITEKEALNHPRRNEIEKALGFGQWNEKGDNFQTGEYEVLENDIVLFCTDGLSDLLDASTIFEVLNKEDSLGNKAKKFIELANGKGGKDNITVGLSTIQSNLEEIDHSSSNSLVNFSVNEHQPKKGALNQDEIDNKNLQETLASFQLTIEELKIKNSSILFKMNIILIFLVLIMGFIIFWYLSDYHHYPKNSVFENSKSIKGSISTLKDSLK